MTDGLDLGIDELSDFQVIGSGGFSTVYSAWDEGFRRRVAVKILHSLDEAGRRRFDRERGIMGQLGSHPNVITPYRAGYTSNGAPYLMMEYVSGGSLFDQVSKRGPIPWPEAVDWVIQSTAALGHAHEQGVLHRDVKPANILLAGLVPKLTDFGIAAIRESTASQVAFTLAHCPPETFSQGRDSRDERSDLYSMASTLFTLVTGRPPFDVDGEDSQQAYMFRIIGHDIPEPPADRVPEPLRDFMRRALSKDPEERPQTATAFQAELSEIRRAHAANQTTQPGQIPGSGPLHPSTRPDYQTGPPDQGQPPAYTTPPGGGSPHVSGPGAHTGPDTGPDGTSPDAGPHTGPGSGSTGPGGVSYTPPGGAGRPTIHTGPGEIGTGPGGPNRPDTGPGSGGTGPHGFVGPGGNTGPGGAPPNTSDSDMTRVAEISGPGSGGPPGGPDLPGTPTVFESTQPDAELTSGGLIGSPPDSTDRSRRAFLVAGGAGLVVAAAGAGAWFALSGDDDGETDTTDDDTDPDVDDTTTTSEAGPEETIDPDETADDGQPALAWRFETGSSLASQPVVADNVLLIGATITDTIHAVDTDTGEELWSFETGGHVQVTGATDGSMAWIGSDDGSLYAFDLYEGDLLWAAELGSAVTGNAYLQGANVIVGTEAGLIHAVDQESGEEAWVFDTGSGQRINTTPAEAQYADQGVIVVASTDGGVYLINTESGELVERIAVEGAIWFSSPLVVDSPGGEGQEVWVGSSLQDGGFLNRIELATGEVHAFPNSAGVGTNPVATGDGAIVAGNDAGELFAVDQVTLGERWREGYADATQIKGSPVIHEDVIIFGTHDRELIAVDFNGVDQWRFEGEQIFGLSGPVVVDDQLYVGNDSGTVYRFDL